MKIWVVSEGSYSDYRIVALFCTELEAKTFVGGSSAEIEAWDTGIPDRGFYQRVWTVYLVLETGERRSDVYISNPRYEQHPKGWSESKWYRLYRDSSAVGRSVVSEDHAFKLAVEARQAWLREEAAA